MIFKRKKNPSKPEKGPDADGGNAANASEPSAASCGDGSPRISHVPVPRTSPAAGKKLWEADLPEGTIVMCIQRNGRSIVPSGDTRIYAGDTLVMISAGGRESEAVRAITGNR